jgi:dienelactone hydrolase
MRLGFSAVAGHRLGTGGPALAQQDLRIPEDIEPAPPRQDLSKEQIRPKLRELLGLDPVPNQVPLETSEPETSRDGLELTVLGYRNSLGDTVPGVLAVPAGADTGTLAGVVCMSGTGGGVEMLTDPQFGNRQPGTGRLMGWGRELARRGFATLSITLRGTTSRHISSVHWEKHIRFLAPYGRTMMGVMVDEALRAARILAAHEAVNPSRIGMTGMSLGGNVTWYGMASDPTIRVGVPVAGSVGSLATAIHEGDVNRHSSYFYIPHMLRYFDHPQVVGACICPRPFMVIAPTRDEDMPTSGVEKMMSIVKPVYDAAGHPERFKVYQPESNHVYTEEYFERVVEWLKKFC